MTKDIFENIINWNKERDNLNFNHTTEIKMLAEELFEFCGYSREKAKMLSKDFISNHNCNKEISKSDLADAAGDLIFIAVGTIAKLGLNPYEVMTKICEHNNAKGKAKDSDGKIIKNSNFIEPVHK